MLFRSALFIDIRGTTDVNEQSAVGKKNDYVDINDFTTKRYVALDNDDKDRKSVV